MSSICCLSNCNITKIPIPTNIFITGPKYDSGYLSISKISRIKSLCFLFLLSRLCFFNECFLHICRKFAADTIKNTIHMYTPSQKISSLIFPIVFKLKRNTTAIKQISMIIIALLYEFDLLSKIRILFSLL